MKRWPWILLLLLAPTLAHAAAYTVNTNAAGERVLDRAIMAGGSHAGQTKTQVLQRLVNSSLRTIGEQQLAGDARQVNDRMDVTTQGALVNGINAIDAGIALPVITAVPNRTDTTGTVQAVPVLVTDPDDKPVTMTASGLPPGITVGNNLLTGVIELQGTLGTPGTYQVTLKAYKDGFRNLGGVTTFDIFATSTFQWIVSP